ncbi:diacylglycerol kinase [Niallia circulans]|jgi:undecaprenol kinase|uniref:Diacylglycerol kinase n=1 Tax=Niallia circulans TaxID=1397 RepID=A0A0J1IN00_NIACI|nr:diacylglycerol kinase family protein [Niallia circulans]KLV27313.1 diacylglycerol kinase [Niallia circulans]MCM2980724.1 diacylglycerol kinase family protein [Niallia circulans]MDR4314346.1 diacylglycerol kinase family protein [Niallia circulans]MED3839430.1 diacylglycerol kinase family protein [Niallia circulans]MED4242502.1 diacylglycerol kinase family protein [Niallia circulans]
MSSDYKDKRIRKNSQLSSFRLAILGILTAIKQERNVKIHLVITILVIVLGLLNDLSKQEWMLIAFCIGLVISLELINTAIERVVDLVTSEYHPLAKEAKDIAAGAVFVAAILSIVIGGIIFIPKIWSAIIG